MVIMTIDMFMKIRAQKRTLGPQTQIINGDPTTTRDRRVHNQMILLMLSTIAIFLVTTLPWTIDRTITAYSASPLSNIPRLLISRTILVWFQSQNAAVSFIREIYERHYLYCVRLTSIYAVLLQHCSGKNFCS